MNPDTFATDTYFLSRCPSCGARARVASRHAGMSVVCPSCGVRAPARPEVFEPPKPQAVPGSGRITSSGQTATSRTARTSAIPTPTVVPTSTSVRRSPAAEATSTRYHSASLVANTPRHHPGMDGFGDDSHATGPLPPVSVAPATATVSRSPTVTATQRRTPPTMQARPLPAPTYRRDESTAWVLPSAIVITVVSVAIAIWSVADASATKSRALRAEQENDRLREDFTAARTRSEDLDRRLAQSTVELSSSQAAAARERDIAKSLTVTNARLAEEIATRKVPIADIAKPGNPQQTH